MIGSGEPRRSGFTFIELCVVLAIVAILAAIAIPSYRKYVTESKMSYAKTQLKAMALSEELYHSKHHTYTDDKTKLKNWLDTYGPYSFSIESAGNSTFTIKAQGNIDGDATLDVWTIDETGNLTHMVDDSSS